MILEKNLTDKQKAKKKKRQCNLLYDFVKITGALPTLILMRPRIYYPHGKKRYKGGFLAACNHVDFLDPVVLFLVFWYRRVHSIATSGLFSSKLKKLFFSNVLCIPIDKSNFTVGTMRTICQRLKDGHVVSIFPEGRVVSNEDERSSLSYKSGVILMAHRSNVPIVPVYIKEIKKWYNRRVIVVGEPLYVNTEDRTPTKAEIQEYTRVLRQKELELRNYLLNNYKKAKPEASKSEGER